MSKTPSRHQQSPSAELAGALAACRGAFVAISLFSGMSNILMLTGSFFMLEIYDRVLPSRSLPTLVVLVILAGGLYVAQGILDLIRGRILVRIGRNLEEALSERVYDVIVRLPLTAGSRGDGIQPMRDLDTVRSFLSGLGPIALFDLPWMPIYLVICFLFHPLIGYTALGGAIVLMIITVLTEVFMRAPAKAVAEFAPARNDLLEASRRNTETLTAMGMAARVRRRWSEINQQFVTRQQRASDVGGGFGAVSKVLRLTLQSAVLAVGAYLVINQQATAGIIIAGSILSSRALAPVDLAIAHWRGFVAARQSWQRLVRLFAVLPPQQDPMPLQRPCKNLAVVSASVAPPGSQKIVVQDVNFVLDAGAGLGIIGPSASGKSSLARMLVGAWQPVRGKVCLDGAALNQWSPDALGHDIGYVPQNVELIPGTIAETISRFEENREPEAVILAAKAAGVHELIVGLPEGYETRIGEHGGPLSAGQTQRIALARALYRNPFLVVLDEPNSNLDSEGDEALTRAILGVRKRGGVVVVIAHRPSAIAGVDLVMVMTHGRVAQMGPKEEVLAKVLPRPQIVPMPKASEAGLKL
jgi:ATP-binding cassette subfamily C protein